MDEFEVMKSIDQSLESLPLASQNRVIAWAYAKYSERPTGKAISTPSSSRAQAVDESDLKEKKRDSVRKFRIIEDLHDRLVRSSELNEFIAQQEHRKYVSKCLVAVYYLYEYEGMKRSITVNHVYTFFNAVGWEVPSDLANTIHQAGSVGYLRTSNTSDLWVEDYGYEIIEDGDDDEARDLEVDANRAGRTSAIRKV